MIDAHKDNTTVLVHDKVLEGLVHAELCWQLGIHWSTSEHWEDRLKEKDSFICDYQMKPNSKMDRLLR